MRSTLCLAVFLLCIVACARHDPAVPMFESKLSPVSEAITGAAASSYIYRLSETPEEQVMQKTMELVRRRSASSADLQAAIEAEEARRVKYIDSLDDDIEKARGAVADLSRTANAILDDEVRKAALKIVAYHQEQIRLCSAIARAQRTRSFLTRSFLEALVDKTPVTKNDRLAGADADGERARARLEEIASAEEMLVAEFRGIKERRVRATAR